MSNPVGRPTEYKPEYCQMVIDHMSQGLSFETFCAVVGVSKQCLYEWRQKHSEFGDAVAKAFHYCQLFWEKEGIAGLRMERGSSFSQNVWSFNMKNRFKWTDKTEVEVGKETRKAIRLAYSLEDEEK